jgi:hypothetical protein
LYALAGATFAIALTLSPQPTEAASFLSRCAGGAEDAELAVTAARPTGAGCTAIMLPIEAAEVLAAVPAPRRIADAPEPEALTVTGRGGEGGFAVREVAILPISAATPPPYLVPGTDFRAIAAPHPLGPSPRATLGVGGEQTVLECAPGDEAAGFALATVRVPPIPGMTVRLVHSAEHTFRLMVARKGVPEEPRLLAKLKTADSATEAQVPLPADLPADTPLDFEMLCPTAGGRLVLGEFVLEAKTAVPADRAAWVRDVELWQKNPAKVFSHAQRWGITRLYVNVPIGEHGLADPQALAGFIAAAGDRGIAIWALLIDGGESDEARLARAGGALADYNAGMPAEAQIKGVAVERAPERLWGYVSDPGTEAQRFLRRLEHLETLIGMPLMAVVPSWFPTDAAVADRMATVVDSLTVISNRTEDGEIRRSVARFLAWGARHGRRVDIALEAMPFPDEERRSFRREAAGDAWLIPLGGNDVLLLLKEPREGLPGRAFGHGDVTPVPGVSRSFAGDHAAMRESLGPLGRTLGAWPSFAGFAFHGLLHDHH